MNDSHNYSLFVSRDSTPPVQHYAFPKGGTPNQQSEVPKPKQNIFVKLKNSLLSILRINKGS